MTEPTPSSDVGRYSRLCPTASVSAPGASVTADAIGGTTSATATVVRLPAVAVTRTRPFAIPRTQPSGLTVARLLSELLQLNVADSTTLPFSSTRLAYRRTLS